MKITVLSLKKSAQVGNKYIYEVNKTNLQISQHFSLFND